MIIVGEKGIYQICVNDYPMAIQLDQTIDMAHRDKMKEDLGTLINHKIRLHGTLDTNIFKMPPPYSVRFRHKKEPNILLSKKAAAFSSFGC